MIETESELTLGMTVADWWRVTKMQTPLYEQYPMQTGFLPF